MHSSINYYNHNNNYRLCVLPVATYMCIVHKPNDSKRVLKIYVCNRIYEKGLIHASNFSNLRICNSACAGHAAMKFGSRTFLSLYLQD